MEKKLNPIRWRISNAKDDDGNIILKAQDAMDGQAYFTIMKEGSYDAVGFFYPKTPSTYEQMVADAKLIASAPQLQSINKDLIDALEKLLSLYTGTANPSTRITLECKSILNNAKNLNHKT